ncbi:unnamed protein product [Dimorphilus gyrociliatus]|uniref:Glutathione peroxidase n=1 Tax=Dimorphilus gyrociliatus TaxID=2664684 RepID=A0A7I8VND1_9ANNE|nr:unnamed protein product [Dimorphilus gyrociliatus]
MLYLIAWLETSASEKKMSISIFFALFIFSGYLTKGRVASDDFYTFEAVDINGQVVNMENYRGKVVLIVNVASQCGFTDGHYSSLPTLQELLGKNNKFQVLAFPCNQFGGQEPWTNKEIKNWVTNKYKLNFPLFSKINVIEENVHPIFQYVIKLSGKEPNWNFWKYLIDHTGKVQHAWGPWSDIEEIFPYVKTAVEMAEKIVENDGDKHDRTIVRDDL